MRLVLRAKVTNHSKYLFFIFQTLTLLEVVAKKGFVVRCHCSETRPFEEEVESTLLSLHFSLIWKLDIRSSHFSSYRYSDLFLFDNRLP